jgi:hypothetical protein
MKILSTPEEILQELITCNGMCYRYNIVCDPKNKIFPSQSQSNKEIMANPICACPLYAIGKDCGIWSRRERAINRLEEFKKIKYIEDL